MEPRLLEAAGAEDRMLLGAQAAGEAKLERTGRGGSASHGALVSCEGVRR